MTKILYTAHGTATHGGRNGGQARTDDGKVAVKLSVPKAMGGDDGPGTNPEQLFSLGYSACFLGAMAGAARKAGKKLPEGAEVHADVSFADREDNVGFTIVPVPATVPPTLSSIVRFDDPPPHLGAGGTKLRRPPKSFV